MKANKKIIHVSILILAFILLFSTLAYAKPFTDSFRGGLLQINDFFSKEQYKPYATAIDFFFFALLFIAIYMMGARYAFKEVKKPEQTIVILLGLMTAFLLVLGGFSAVVLIPYLHWLLYTLLFILYWWLLKGIKNKFWRFILALLLTLLTIGLLQGLFAAISPEAQVPAFFKDLGAAFAGIKFPELPGAPGVPPALRDLFGAVTPVTTPTGPTTLPPTITPTAEAPGKGGIFGTGVSWWWLALIPLIAAGIWRRKDIAGLLKRGERRPEATLINEIDEMTARKTNKMTELKQANEEKNTMIQIGENRIAIIEKLEDPSYAWEAVRSIQEGHPLKDLYNKELQLITKLKELKDIEKDFIENKLRNWQERVQRETGRGITLQLNELRDLVTHKTTIRDIINMGIYWLIVICYDFEKREVVLSKELEELLREGRVEDLIRDKFAKVKEDKNKLHTYNSYEIGIIKLLSQKIELQKNKLEELKRIIAGQAPPTQPPVPPTTAPTPPPPTPPPPRAPGPRAPAAPPTEPAANKDLLLNQIIESIGRNELGDAMNLIGEGIRSNLLTSGEDHALESIVHTLRGDSPNKFNEVREFLNSDYARGNLSPAIIHHLLSVIEELAQTGSPGITIPPDVESPINLIYAFFMRLKNKQFNESIELIEEGHRNNIIREEERRGFHTLVDDIRRNNFDEALYILNGLRTSIQHDISSIREEFESRGPKGEVYVPPAGQKLINKLEETLRFINKIMEEIQKPKLPKATTPLKVRITTINDRPIIYQRGRTRIIRIPYENQPITAIGLIEGEGPKSYVWRLFDDASRREILQQLETKGGWRLYNKGALLKINTTLKPGFYTLGFVGSNKVLDENTYVEDYVKIEILEPGKIPKEVEERQPKPPSREDETARIAQVLSRFGLGKHAEEMKKAKGMPEDTERLRDLWDRA